MRIQNKISVLIPCYNGLPFVHDAVASVLGQGVDGLECVVVDDGSSDASAVELGSRFGDRIRLIRQPNGGPASARNRALAESTGELIILFDADDLMPEGTLAGRIAEFDRDPGLEMLVGQNEIFNIDTGSREVWPQPPVGDEFLRTGLLSRQNLPHLNVLTFRREAAFRVGPFDLRFRMSDDYDLWLRAWASLRWSFVPAIVSQQRNGSYESQTRRQDKISTYRCTEIVFRKNRRVIREYFGTDRVWREAYASWASDFATVLLRAGRRAEAFMWSARAISVSRGKVGPSAYKSLAEAALPIAVYTGVREALRRAL